MRVYPDTWDEEGYAIRDPDSTTYVGAIETADEFGKRIYLEAWKRGWSRALKKVVMGDGAEWIWNQAELHFPNATPRGTLQNRPVERASGTTCFTSPGTSLARFFRYGLSRALTSPEQRIDARRG